MKSSPVDLENLLSVYRSNQREIYENGMFHSVFPRVTTDASRVEEQAKQHLSLKSYQYLHGGAGELATQEANRAAFRQWQIIPRMMVDTSKRTLQTTLFGETYASPLIQAPVSLTTVGGAFLNAIAKELSRTKIGVQSIFHQDKEVGLAEVCAELGVPFVLSTVSTSSIEEVSQASGDGPQWYQLYWPSDDDITVSLLQRAQSAGFKVLVVTLDTWTPAWRPLDLDLGYLPMVNGAGNQIAFSDPVFREKFKRVHGVEVENNIPLASREWLQTIVSGVPHTWDQMPFLREHWTGPIVLKGIQHPDDAKLAMQAGCDGIIVSNHGGRQLDGAVGSLSMLPLIVDAVGGRMTVLFDSGVRTGADILKALCLGAKGVLVGRPTIAGYSIAGKHGAHEVLRGLLTDLDRTMGLSGITDLRECNASVLRATAML